MKNHPLTPEYSRYGTFDKLGEDNQLQIKNLVIELASKKHKKGSEKQKIGDLYNLGMDSIKRNQQAAEPIADILNDIVTIIKDILKYFIYLTILNARKEIFQINIYDQFLTNMR